MSTSVLEMQNVPHFNKSSLFLRFNSFPMSSHASNIPKKRSASYLDFKEEINPKKLCLDIEKFNEKEQQSVIDADDVDFIEISKFIELMNDAVIIDCRLFKDFLCKRIQNSVHINCLDSITRKRLLSNKLSVKDLLSCDKVKKRLENIINTKNEEANLIENELLIVIYDESTNNQSELINHNNPLKLVLDNIKNTLKNTDCKILKGT